MRVNSVQPAWVDTEAIDGMANMFGVSRHCMVPAVCFGCAGCVNIPPRGEPAASNDVGLEVQAGSAALTHNPECSWSAPEAHQSLTDVTGVRPSLSRAGLDAERRCATCCMLQVPREKMVATVGALHGLGRISTADEQLCSCRVPLLVRHRRNGAPVCASPLDLPAADGVAAHSRLLCRACSGCISPPPLHPHHTTGFPASCKSVFMAI